MTSAGPANPTEHLVALLDKVPVSDRERFARSQLAGRYDAIIAAFDRIAAARRKRTVLFISLRPHHTREPTLAAAARLAGWDTMMLYSGRLTYAPSECFDFTAEVTDTLALLLLAWIFPGPLVHIFVAIGSDAFLLCRLKHRRIILDIYDTCSGILKMGAPYANAEREAIRMANALTHRDLRGQYLRKLHRYVLPPHNGFFLDPITHVDRVKPRIRSDDEIRVVCVGWVSDPESSIIDTARAFAAGGVHVHVYLHPLPPTGAELAPYRRLQVLYPEHFHLEEPVFGETYFEHLRRYDFGLMPCEQPLFQEPPFGYTEDYLRGCGSARLMDYIQSGLGIIISPERRFQFACAQRYATAVVTPSLEMFHRPREILDAARKRFRTIEPARFDSITPKGISTRLGRFYRAVGGEITVN